MSNPVAAPFVALRRPSNGPRHVPDTASTPPPHAEAPPHAGTGERFLALDRAAAARPHFARAHALLTAYDRLVRDEPERLERLRRLGNE